MKTFTHCDVEESKMLYRWQIFSNGMKHIACHCPKCNTFIDYAPKTKPYIDLVNGIYLTAIKERQDLTANQEIKKTTVNSHTCKQCNLSIEENIYEWKSMKDGKIGIKAICGGCGKYIGYVPVTKQYKELANKGSGRIVVTKGKVMVYTAPNLN